MNFVRAEKHRRRRGARWILATALATPLGLLAALVPGQVAGASSFPFTFTGGEQNFTVPSGVTAIEVIAAAAGGGFEGPVSGGLGATVTTVIAVIPGEKLYIEVGGAGLESDEGAHAFNGGGASGAAGGGGGATDIRTCSTATCSQASSLASRLVVAGGGGGAAFDFDDLTGVGGSAGRSPLFGAGAGGNGCDPDDCGGPGGPSGLNGSAGGAGGRATPEVPCPGNPGSLGFGGDAPVSCDTGDYGGGGGGGYFGGGGGGDGNSSGGGGGAGSSFVSAPISLTLATNTGGVPSVIILTNCTVSRFRTYSCS